MTPNKFQHAGLDWVPHTPGDPMPCPPDTLVRVLLRYEQAEMLYDAAERLIPAVQWDWSQCGSGSIIGWHPIEEQPVWPNVYATVETNTLRRVLDLLETGDIEQAKHELRKELE